MWWLLLFLLLSGCISPHVAEVNETIETPNPSQNHTIDKGTAIATEPLESGEAKGVTVVVEIVGNTSEEDNESKNLTSTIGENNGKEMWKVWHYQLQEIDKNSLLSLNVSIIVIDPDEGPNCKEIEEIRKSGKKVLAYLSIGEAEEYRDYWKSNWGPGHPSFIVKENPEWEGNYIVKFWDPQWKGIVKERVEEISPCYDGLYLDRIDVYREFDKPLEMVKFVKEIREIAKALNPSILIVAQNALELYQYEDYQAAIDGFGMEDTWYNGDERQEEEHKEEVLKWARKAHKDGKLILAIDYPTRIAPICNFYRACFGEGFYCTVEDRELSYSHPVLCPTMN